jgi:hypothetical protein
VRCIGTSTAVAVLVYDHQIQDSPVGASFYGLCGNDAYTPGTLAGTATTG